jgi:hypothetical protein
MERFEVDAADASSNIRRARDTHTGRAVVLERGIRSDRLRQLEAVPPCAAIAPFERTRDGQGLRLVHPAPLELESPVDEFDVVQAIGSMLDGLAWLHLHGVAHGAVSALALTAGPTGGRLSLAGAFSAATATPRDDVYAASALARRLLVGGAAASEAADDIRLERYASIAVVEAIRAGLDPDAAQRPSAIRLATMVRGEFLTPVAHVDTRDPLMVRWHASMRHVFRTYGSTIVSIGAALAALILIASLAAADQRDPPPQATPRSLAEEPSAVEVLSESVQRVPATTSTVVPTPVVPTTAVTTATTARSDQPTPVVAPPATSAPANDVLPTTTIAAPPPPTTTVAPKPPPPTTPSTSTASTTTGRPPSTTTTRSTSTTTTAPKGKGPK